MSFNPVFEQFENLYGFDKSVKPHWQMIPLDGEKKIYLTNAEGLTVQAVNPNIVQILEETLNFNVQPKNKRLFTLKGKAYGTTYLEVRKGSVVQTRLEIAVKKLKKVSLAFNFVSDEAGRTTNKNPTFVTNWMDKLINIYEPQTNITFSPHSAKIVKIKNNLGSEVDSVDTKGSEWEWDAIVRKRDNSADINLFFVWKLANTSFGKTAFRKGETFKKDCFISDYHPQINMEQEVIVMAHEIGHALGIPDDKHFYNPKNRNRFMMYFSSRFSGAEIPKVHVNIVNP